MILNIDDWVKKTIILGSYIPKITSPSLRLKNGSYDAAGLYSTEFFGQQGSDKWRRMYSVIELPQPILHPAIYYVIDRRVSYLQKWINLSIGCSYENKKAILTNNINQYNICGLNGLYDNSEMVCDLLASSGKIDTKAGRTLIDNIKRKNPLYWISYIIVPPPLFRPNDDDNAPFIKIIEELQILRSAINTNDNLLKGRLLLSIQSIHNGIFTSMVDKVKGKTGLVRGQMLGRTCDFSGRAVIVGDPQVDADHLGVPKTMLVRLYYPWIIHYILTNKEIAYELSKYVPVNKPSLHTLINERLYNEALDPKILDILYAVTAEVIKDKVIIAKRDPSLHKLSVRAYYPIMIDDSSLHISPSVCPGHNADFDGDQMAVFVPLSKESQEEAIAKMLPSNNIWDPREGLSLKLEKDFPAAIYFITRDEPNGNIKVINNDIDLFELIPTVESFSQKIQYKNKINSIGRRIVELIFDDEINVTDPVNSKMLEKILIKFANVKPGKYIVAKILKIQQIGSTVTSIMGGDISAESFRLSPDLAKRRDEVLAHLDKYDVSKELKDITDEFTKREEQTGQFAAIAKISGGGKADFQQLSVAKGYISDVDGNTDPDPIKSNFVDGFKSIDYFKSASGSRKGVVDRVMNTAKSGYLSRQMVYLMASLKSGPVKDCKTHRFFDIVLTEELVEVLDNRILSNGDILTAEYAKSHNLYDKKISVYSPLYCHSKTLCEKCYPFKFRKMVNDIPNVGIVAAQAVGERCTQLTMKTFHSGGASKIIYLNTECPNTTDYINQDGLQLFAKSDIQIKLEDPSMDTDNTYSVRDFSIIIDGESIEVNFSAMIEFDGLSASNVDRNGSSYTLTFEANSMLGEINASASDVTSATMVLQSIMDHTDAFETPEQIVMELYETFKIASKIPLLYLEMLVSQLIRDPDKPIFPYRLGSMDKDPMFVGIKKVAAIENPIRGIMFERISDVIINNIINGNEELDRSDTPKSDLEDLFRL